MAAHPGAPAAGRRVPAADAAVQALRRAATPRTRPGPGAVGRPVPLAVASRAPVPSARGRAGPGTGPRGSPARPRRTGPGTGATGRAPQPGPGAAGVPRTAGTVGAVTSGGTATTRRGSKPSGARARTVTPRDRDAPSGVPMRLEPVHLGGQRHPARPVAAEVQARSVPGRGASGPVVPQDATR
ncbi:hypothetical protein NUM3379_39750 [Kineococcus sp. NUM-3379]